MTDQDKSPMLNVLLCVNAGTNDRLLGWADTTKDSRVDSSVRELLGSGQLFIGDDCRPLSCVSFQPPAEGCVKIVIY